MSTTIGIDLGTTYTLAAVMMGNGNIEVIYNEEGDPLTNSYVSFTDTTALVGRPAVWNQRTNIENTVYAVKRLIGRDFDDPSIDKFKSSVPYHVIDKENKPVIKVKHLKQITEKTPVDVSAIILEKMRKTAEQRLNKSIKRAVITVPAYFNPEQKRETKEAARLAGFTDYIRLISEPGAAAYYYGSLAERADGYHLLVFDFGGGTFDVAIIEVCGDQLIEKVLNGDATLGGLDLDKALMAHVRAKVMLRFSRDPLGTHPEEKAYKRLVLAAKCEELKIALSSAEEYSICMLEFFNDIRDNLTFTRDEFNEVCHALMQRAIDLTMETLDMAGLQPPDIDQVLLVGGTTRIPKLKLMLIEAGFNANRREQFIETENKEQVVARGAALCAAKLDGGFPEDQLPKLDLVQVSNLSIGTGFEGRSFRMIIPRNSPLPVECSAIYTTWDNDQDSISFTIVEGERAIVSRNDFSILGECTMTGLPRRIVGGVRVELILKLDVDGILTATIKHGRREEVFEIKRKSTRNPKRGIGQRLQSAKRHRNCDMVEVARLKAKAILRKQIKRIKYTGTRVIKNLCERYEGWLTRTNRTATKETYEQQLREFHKELNPLVRRY